VLVSTRLVEVAHKIGNLALIPYKRFGFTDKQKIKSLFSHEVDTGSEVFFFYLI